MNGASASTQITRSTFVAALAGIVNLILLFVPLEDTLRATILASLNPAIIIAASVLFAWVDRHVMDLDGLDGG